MASTKANSAPRTWTEAELGEQAQIALDGFVDRRLAEPEETYAAHFKARRRALVRLFRKLSGVDPGNPSAALVRDVISDEDLFAALRYVAGPPVSEDDLGVLVTRNVSGIAKKALTTGDDLPVAVLKLICRMADPFRFPWVAERRSPTERELRNAVTMTSALHASQSLQTERRQYGRAVEKQLVARLLAMDYVQISGGKGKSTPKAEQPPSAIFPSRGKIS